MLKKCFSYFLPGKDKLYQVGGVKNFVTDHNLLESCKTAHARSQAEDEKRNWRNQKDGKGSKEENRAPPKEVRARWYWAEAPVSKNPFLQKILNIILEWR